MVFALALFAVTFAVVGASKLGLRQMELTATAEGKLTAEWGYARPSTWATDDEDFSMCAGSAQSPIDLKNGENFKLGEESIATQYEVQEDRYVSNTGHNLMVSGIFGTLTTPVSGSFGASQLEFHSPSEHLVKGKASAMEMHILHEDLNKQKMAVLSILFDVGAENKFLKELLDDAPEEHGAPVAIGSVDILESFGDILSGGFWEYQGSLTSPPCTEGVDRFVMAKHATISKAQVAKFKSLYPDPANSRPVQPLNGRTVTLNNPSQSGIAKTIAKAEKSANKLAKKGLELLEKIPGGHLSVAMRAVLALTFLFFLVTTIIKVVHTKVELAACQRHLKIVREGGSNYDQFDNSFVDGGNQLTYEDTPGEGAAKVSAYAQNLMGGFFSLRSMESMKNEMDCIPMFCVLIVFARMRAVLDLHTTPQPYAQAFFIICVVAIYTQAIAGIFFNKTGEGCAYWVGKVLDWLASLLLYLGTFCIIVSICTLERCATPENKDQAFMCMVGNKDVTGLVQGMKEARHYVTP